MQTLSAHGFLCLWVFPKTLCFGGVSAVFAGDPSEEVVEVTEGDSLWGGMGLVGGLSP